MDTFLEGRLEIISGDITRINADAIVNAANSSLMGGGGVDGAIHTAGGETILKECKEIRRKSFPDGLPPGEAVITTGGNLPARYVIHTVGPVWHGGKRNEDAILYNAYRNSLLLAGRKGISSIAFPAISTGIYGFPKERAARIAFQAVREYISQEKTPWKIIFVFYSPADRDLCISTILELKKEH